MAKTDLMRQLDMRTIMRDLFAIMTNDKVMILLDRILL
jgi:hypothetical protein